MKNEEFIIFNNTQGVFESWAKDLVTFIFVLLCVWVSRDSAWWTFFTGCFALLFFSAKLHRVYQTRRIVLKSKAEAIAWAQKLPD